MPRNSSGVYSLPESPFVAGTVIQSSPVNNDFSDIATALTLSLATNGVSSMTGPIKAANGSVIAPSITWDDSQGTGWYRVSADTIGYAVSGVNKATYNSDGTFDFTAIKFGNAAVSGNYLDWYEEGIFTPVLRFGGSTAGITYEQQDGRFTRIGNLVFINIEIDITSSGSGVGDATITGIPYSAAFRTGMPLFLVHSMDLPANFHNFSGFLNETLNTIEIVAYDENAENTVTLQDDNFTNNSAITIVGFYWAG